MPRSGDPVTVQFFKYPDRPHWRHTMVWLGEDKHGVWLGAPVGTVVQRGKEPPVTMEHAFVQLIPEGGWWAAIFNAESSRTRVYVDVTTPPQWVTPHRVEMIDLDLDVILRRDGTLEVDDEDEFELHRRQLAYPQRLVDAARGAAARLVVALETENAPFDGSSGKWLARL